MKIGEFVEILKQYPQHQDVMISCGNCNHGHIWYEGTPVIEDYTNQTYGYINIKILDDKNLGSTFVLHQQGLRVLEQDVAFRSQRKCQEEPSEDMRVHYYSLHVVSMDLKTFYTDYSIYNYMTEKEWAIRFIEDYKDDIVQDDFTLLKCDQSKYDGLIDMMLESLEGIKGEHDKCDEWDRVIDQEQSYDFNKLVEQITGKEV